MSEYKGELKGFPKEVVEKMLDEQEAQGNKRDVTVFERARDSYRMDGGFFWDDTDDSDIFWLQVIRDKNFDLFFQRYPKIPSLLEAEIETKPDRTPPIKQGDWCVFWDAGIWQERVLIFNCVNENGFISVDRGGYFAHWRDCQLYSAFDPNTPVSIKIEDYDWDK